MTTNADAMASIADAWVARKITAWQKTEIDRLREEVRTMTTKLVTTHTPGPWEVDPQPIRGFRASVSSGKRAEGEGVLVAACYDVGFDGNTQANVRLIASAPRLLAALEALLAQADETYPHFEDVRGTATRDAARAAIEQASC